MGKPAEAETGGLERRKAMTLEMEHNIDMILVNPSEEERIRSTFTMNGMLKEASLITPCIFVPKGQMMACDRGKAMQIGIKFGDEGNG